MKTENPAQRDFFIELADARQIDSMELQAAVERLPPSAWIKTSDLAAALDVVPSTIVDYVRKGAIVALNYGTRDQPRYKFARESVLNFLKKRLNNANR